MADMQNLSELVEKSSSTDVQVLLTVKEQLKREMLADPSNPSLSAAFERAAKNLAQAMQHQEKSSAVRIDNVAGVLSYIAENGRKVGRSKLFADVRDGRIRRQADGSFSVRHVEAYMKSLPWAGTPSSLAERVEDRQRRKEEAEIRRAEAVARREEFDLAARMGRYILKEDVYHELAVRAVTLREGLKVSMLARAPQLIGIVKGDPSKADSMMAFFERMVDELMGQYARPVTIEAVFKDMEEEENGEGVKP